MKKTVTLTISTLVLCGSIATAEAAKHHAPKTSKHTTATAHHTSHHTQHNSEKHSTHHHASFSHKSAFQYHASNQHNPHQGVASLYSSKFQGHKTANGERYNMHELTAAHRSLPLSSYVKVTNVNNHRSVVVRINDRGPFHGNRVMDLSTAAAAELGISGTAAVTITPLALN